MKHRTATLFNGEGAERLAIALGGASHTAPQQLESRITANHTKLAG